MSDVYVRITRPEGYEDVHSDLVIEDAAIHAEFEYENVTDEIERLQAKLREGAKEYQTVSDQLDYVQARVEALEGAPIKIQVKPDGQAWIIFDAGAGRGAMLSLNNIVVDMPKVGINRGICMDALLAATEQEES